MKRIVVRLISCDDKGKIDERIVHTETLLIATRVMLSFRPKRGYELKKTIIEEIEVLV